MERTKRSAFADAVQLQHLVQERDALVDRLAVAQGPFVHENDVIGTALKNNTKYRAPFSELLNACFAIATMPYEFHEIHEIPTRELFIDSGASKLMLHQVTTAWLAESSVAVPGECSDGDAGFVRRGPQLGHHNADSDAPWQSLPKLQNFFADDIDLKGLVDIGVIGVPAGATFASDNFLGFCPNKGHVAYVWATGKAEINMHNAYAEVLGHVTPARLNPRTMLCVYMRPGTGFELVAPEEGGELFAVVFEVVSDDKDRSCMYVQRLRDAVLEVQNESIYEWIGIALTVPYDDPLGVHFVGRDRFFRSAVPGNVACVAGSLRATCHTDAGRTRISSFDLQIDGDHPRTLWVIPEIVLDTNAKVDHDTETLCTVKVQKFVVPMIFMLAPIDKAQ